MSFFAFSYRRDSFLPSHPIFLSSFIIIAAEYHTNSPLLLITQYPSSSTALPLSILLFHPLLVLSIPLRLLRVRHILDPASTIGAAAASFDSLAALRVVVLRLLHGGLAVVLPGSVNRCAVGRVAGGLLRGTVAGGGCAVGGGHIAAAGEAEGGGAGEVAVGGHGCGVVVGGGCWWVVWFGLVWFGSGSVVSVACEYGLR